MPSGSSLGCFWPLLCLLSISYVFQTFFCSWDFDALDFLSLTLSSKPGVPLLERYRQSVTGNNTCNIVCCTRRSCKCGSIGGLTVNC